MGGSGSGGGGGNPLGGDPSDVAENVRRALEQVDEAKRNTIAQKFLTDLLRESRRNVEPIRERSARVGRFFSSHAPRATVLAQGWFAGSHRTVTGFTDADVVLYLNEQSWLKITPEQTCRKLASELQERAGEGAAVPAQMGFAVQTHDPIAGDATLQVLPALVLEGEAFVPSEDGQSWQQADPTAFVESIAKVAQDNPLIIPTLKLAKSLIAELPQEKRPPGLLLEALGLEVFSQDDVPSQKDAIIHFLSQSSQLLTVAAGQFGKNLVDALRDISDVQRRVFSDGLSRIARRLRNADIAATPDAWKEAFNIRILER